MRLSFRLLHAQSFDYVEACRVVIVLWLAWTLTILTAQVGHWST
jgi:hypothetical protein